MARWLRRCVFLALVPVLLSSVGPVAPTGAGALPDSTGVTTRASVRTGGAQANAQGPAAAGRPAMADNGAVAFVSDATNLVPGDHNAATDVFVSQNGVITRVSVGPGGAEANGPSFAPAISADGRWVAFDSAATNLVPDDTNNAVDVFLYDRSQVKPIVRVSVAIDGSQGNGDSVSPLSPPAPPSVSSTGLVVAFTSQASNLVPGDTNGAPDVFVRTIGPSPSTTLVSATPSGAAAGNGGSDEPSLSRDGLQVVFSSDAGDLVSPDSNNATDVFWRDLTAGSTKLMSLKDGSNSTQGNGRSFNPSLSGDGALIAFASAATNLLTNKSDDNHATDVFYRDRAGTATTLVSRDCSGSLGNGDSSSPHITTDNGTNPKSGVVFVSEADNLLDNCGSSEPDDTNGVTDVYIRPLRQSPVVNERISRDTAGAQFTRPSVEAAVSGDGLLAAFTTGGPDESAGGSGGGSDVFGRNRGVTPNKTDRLSAPTNGQALGPAATHSPVISGDGKTVAYVSSAPDLVTDDGNGFDDVFVTDREKNQTTRVSLGLSGAQANGPSGLDSAPALSADGQIVAFASRAGNLVTPETDVAGREDVFVYDRARKESTRVSIGPGGVQPSGDSYSPALSADGRYVAFASDADNLVPGDTNKATDVFVYDRQVKITVRVSVGPAGLQADEKSFAPSISGDGTAVGFTSEAANLVSGQANNGQNVFLRDLKANTMVQVSKVAASDGSASSAAVSADGRFVAFARDGPGVTPGDSNNAAGVFLFDRQGGTTERVSVGQNGDQGNGGSAAPSLSADGRFVAFSSDATNLVPADTNYQTDIFVRDRRFGTTTRVSLGPTAVQANRASALPSISGNGRFVAFQSAATNLVDGDTNSAPDIFVHDRTPVVGYRLVAADGGIFTYGRTPFFGSTGSLKLAKPIVGMAAAPSGQGYWLVASDGGVFAFGDAGFFGSTGSIKLAKPIVGMAATPTGKGYWLVASDGGVFAFGDAGFFGSTGKLKLVQPIVGMAPTPTGKGYWLVGRDGGIFAFGDAPFAGSTGAIRLAQPIVGMAATPAGGGYWLVGSDGGIFAFGDATFFGSTGALKLNKPIVGLSPSPTGAGYWMVASDGGIFAFGDATFFGSAGALKLAQPIVGMSARA